MQTSACTVARLAITLSSSLLFGLSLVCLAHLHFVEANPTHQLLVPDAQELIRPFADFYEKKYGNVLSDELKLRKVAGLLVHASTIECVHSADQTKTPFSLDPIAEQFFEFVHIPASCSIFITIKKSEIHPKGADGMLADVEDFAQVVNLVYFKPTTRTSSAIRFTWAMVNSRESVIDLPSQQLVELVQDRKRCSQYFNVHSLLTYQRTVMLYAASHGIVIDVTLRKFDDSNEPLDATYRRIMRKVPKDFWPSEIFGQWNPGYIGETPYEAAKREHDEYNEDVLKPLCLLVERELAIKKVRCEVPNEHAKVCTIPVSSANGGSLTVSVTSQHQAPYTPYPIPNDLFVTVATLGAQHREAHGAIIDASIDGTYFFNFPPPGHIEVIFQSNRRLQLQGKALVSEYNTILASISLNVPGNSRHERATFTLTYLHIPTIATVVTVDQISLVAIPVMDLTRKSVVDTCAAFGFQSSDASADQVEQSANHLALDWRFAPALFLGVTLTSTGQFFAFDNPTTEYQPVADDIRRIAPGTERRCVAFHQGKWASLPCNTPMTVVCQVPTLSVVMQKEGSSGIAPFLSVVLPVTTTARPSVANSNIGRRTFNALASSPSRIRTMPSTPIVNPFDKEDVADLLAFVDPVYGLTIQTALSTWNAAFAWSTPTVPPECSYMPGYHSSIRYYICSGATSGASLSGFVNNVT